MLCKLLSHSKTRLCWQHWFGRRSKPQPHTGCSEETELHPSWIQYSMKEHCITSVVVDKKSPTHNRFIQTYFANLRPVQLPQLQNPDEDRSKRSNHPAVCWAHAEAAAPSLPAAVPKPLHTDPSRAVQLLCLHSLLKQSHPSPLLGKDASLWRILPPGTPQFPHFKLPEVWSDWQSNCWAKGSGIYFKSMKQYIF